VTGKSVSGREVRTLLRSGTQGQRALSKSWQSPDHSLEVWRSRASAAALAAPQCRAWIC